MDAETQAVFDAAKFAINWHYPESSNGIGWRGLRVALEAHAHPSERNASACPEFVAAIGAAWDLVRLLKLADDDLANIQLRDTLHKALQAYGPVRVAELVPKKACASPPLPELLRRMVSAAGKSAYLGAEGNGEQRLAHQELTEAVHAYLRAESPHLCPPEPTQDS